MFRSHYAVLQRNSSKGYTRGTRLVVLVGQKKGSPSRFATSFLNRGRGFRGSRRAREEAEGDLAVVCKKEARNGIIWRASGRSAGAVFPTCDDQRCRGGTPKPKW